MKLNSGILLVATAVVAATVSYGDPIKNGFVASVETPTGLAYSQSVSVNNHFLSISGAYGNEIELSGTDRTLKSFSVGYYSDYTLNGGITVSFYDNDGLNGFPQSKFYTSTPVDLLLTPPGNLGSVISFNFDLSTTLPDKFTFLVEFSGVDGTHNAGLLLPDTDPAVGRLGDPNYFLLTPDGFVKQSSAFSVPEPNAIALAGIAGLAWLAFAGYRGVRSSK